MGTSFTFGHARILRRYAKKVVLIFDSDIAGIEAANRALDICISSHIDIRLVSLPGAKDPCEFLLNEGIEPFRKLVSDAVDVFQFKWNRLLKTFAGNETLAGKKAAIEEFLQTISGSLRSGSLSPIDRGLIVNRLSKIIGLDSRHINAELTRRLARTKKITEYQGQNRKFQSVDLGQGVFAVAQREILEVLLNEPKLFDIVKQKITAEIFDVPILRQIATILFELLNAEPTASLAAVLAGAGSVEQSSVIVDLAHGGREKGNFQSRLAGALDAVQRHQAQKTKNQSRKIKDQTQFLRRFSENTVKKNPHNIGMVQ
jgi:DNA primase